MTKPGGLPSQKSLWTAQLRLMTSIRFLPVGLPLAQMFTEAKDYTVVVKAAGYEDAAVVQTIKATSEPHPVLHSQTRGG